MKRILLFVLSTILLMFLWASMALFGTVDGWFHQPIARSKTPAPFLKAVNGEMNKQFVGNFAMAVMKNGNVEHEKFYSAGKPVDKNTVFQVSSLSKWISAVGIMKLVEDGKLDLDVPVSNYLTRWQLPPSKFNSEEVTVRRLLSHTAGLTDGLGYSGFEKGTPVQSIEQSLTKAADADEGISGEVRVGVKPGSEFKYSGGGYTLLQLLVEEVSGKSFASYMKENVFIPLNMLHSSYVWQDSSRFALAEFYNSDGSKAGHYRYTSLAATSLYTSLADLELLFQAFLKGKNNEPIGRNVLKPETLVKMREPHGKSMGVDIWGLGTVLYATTAGNDFIIGHDGKSTPPINTAVRLNPETGDGIIVLETGDPALATKLASEWVFWRTGKVDTFLFPMLIDEMLWTIGIGWVVIILTTVLLRALYQRER
ncbi:MAG: beta-lactamase family protein [Flammeovirgaceae bacterium]|jgi:CubicO group peptidase (beta-lactamase class C family)|nr:beta-lactamase family protein [Flammeovirgaceae bacterium]